ncbi:hypothetical protein DVR12_17565 [Chitinophaga silvatica]|uniref:PA14 domain-containing protein n=1 Tax=Chitinophaga silvatica TaxID=2282649 RepID=A0A3E1Y7Z7_9BACT|nr:DUF5977 domain-containing protein [Chitinophaga silvatica]RFS21143.1 hypothetical protein DVR12_17565 [Chitinophaga silvatica]
MILAFVARGKKWIASCLLAMLYLEILIPANVQAKPISTGYRNPGIVRVNHSLSLKSTLATSANVKTAIPVTSATAASTAIAFGGPSQPEVEAFHPASADNMVDLFSGDFSYSIPLLDVGGYPVTLGYNSGITMDQEASWVGLGWNISPGSVTRNLRGLPDDFDGKSDFVTKETTTRKNKTVGITGGMDVEVAGLPAKLGLGVKLGIFHNTYRGWGTESGINASLSAGNKSKGSMTAGLSLDNNSQTGITISPSLSYSFQDKDHGENPYGGSVSLSTGYNSRSGLTSLQLSGGLSKYKMDDKNVKRTSGSGSYSHSSSISFANPAHTPTMKVAYTNKMWTVTLKYGGAATIVHPNFSLSGYISEQYIAEKDKRITLPAYGYLNYQNANGNNGALLDFNREKDIPYRDEPAVPTIAVPSYTYDVFSMTGEGIGGSFRAYRNDIGYVYDHEMTSRDASTALSVDFGVGFIAHTGVDLFATRAYTKSSLWESKNYLKKELGFRKADKDFEPVYFRSPGEKTINSTSFYDVLGGDRVVTAKLEQNPDIYGTNIFSTPNLTPYVNAQQQADIPISADNAVKPAREKRTQVITYLNAKEASEVGLSKYIEYYPENKFNIDRSKAEYQGEYLGKGDGLLTKYYYKTGFDVYDKTVIDSNVNFSSRADFKADAQNKEWFSMKMFGKLKVPFSSTYTFKLRADDGMRLLLNGEEFINDFNEGSARDKYATIPIEGGRLYDIELHYNNYTADAEFKLWWSSSAFGDNGFKIIPAGSFFTEKNDDVFMVDKKFYREKRVNNIKKENHISEIDVLNPDGRRYVYGIPVYNLSQKETTFSVDYKRADINEGLVAYTPNVDDTLNNHIGRDEYYNGQFMPAYAHSFLLTGILSPDYVDVTGNGISDDDAGNAIRFNYTKTADIKNPYSWRAPYSSKATYNEGLKTDNRDDKGSYVSGTKEMYYLHSIESKSMVAVFTLEKRRDLLQIDAYGNKTEGAARLLRKIDLYTKADFLKNTDTNGIVHARPVKTVHFEYTYELCKGINHSTLDTTSGKLTLKEVWFSYNGNEKGKKNPYRFRYNKFNPNYASNKYDRWGNYKDAVNNPAGISNADYPYALQDSTLAARNAAAWTLDTIVLPSGGVMTVDYESDDYGYVQNKVATQMYQVYGFASEIPDALNGFKPKLYDNASSGDNLYVAIRVPYKLNSIYDVYPLFVNDLNRIYFRLAVKMPSDKFGSGIEFVPCYAEIGNTYYKTYVDGNSTVICLPLVGITADGNTPGDRSPLGKAALQFLKLNLPSKAYPGSDVGDDMSPIDAVKILYSQVDNIGSMVLGFDEMAKLKGYAKEIDTSRSFVRLKNPNLKKYGGGIRVKRISSYDNWSKMTGQRGATYGKEYQYTTTAQLNGVYKEISSGVASYEPLLGGEENPWRVPIEYTERVSALAPTTLGYVEEPLGESFFPAASVGYSKVRVRTINAKNNRSVNGYDESNFYTTKEFPTIVERTVINNHNKKRFKDPLRDLLRINAKHLLAVSQGFKVELNDMNGKLRSQATYPEGDSEHPISYTENFYRVDNQNTVEKHLNNKVLTINPKGIIENSEIGKDMELMFDMREEKSVTMGANIGVNVDMFTAGIWPIVIPSVIPLPQHEENIFRSIAATKVINRHGIIDSVMAVDKGSKVVTHNLLYDSESGDPVLTSVQNEFNDKVYNLTYPAGWIYEGMAGAYKNIGTVLSGVYFKGGKIVKGFNGNINDYFFSGDELLVYTKRQVGTSACIDTLAHWPGAFKVWAVNANMLKGGKQDIYFINDDGTPFTGNDVSLKIIRSGRRNIAANAGSISMLKNPLDAAQLVLNEPSDVINASMVEYKEFWKVPDRKVPAIIIDTFRNTAMTMSFLVTCGDNTQMVPITIEAGKFTSVVSQERADDDAKSFLLISGPMLAFNKIGCTYYYSDANFMYFQKQCGDPTAIGELVKYVLNAKADSSLISKADANDKAHARLLAEGQAFANSNGRCYYLSDPTQGNFTRTCTQGIATPVTYYLNRGADTSYISQLDANAKAAFRLAVEGPAYAESNSYCTYFVKLKQEGDWSSASGYYTNLVAYFYEDEACTIPTTATNLPVIINVDESTQVISTSTTDTHKYYSWNVIANGSRAVLKSNVFVSTGSTTMEVTTIIRFYYSLEIPSQYNVIVK